jgi:hypothetical protein
MTATPGIAAAPELQIVLTDAAPLESAGAAVRACALGNGFEAERATRLQVVVEELIRESRMREVAPTTPGDIAIDIAFDGTNLEIAVVDHRLPLTPEVTRHLPSRRLLSLGFVDHLHIGFAGPTGNVATCRLAMDADHADDHLHAEMLAPDAPDAPDTEAEEIEVRRMTPEDADGLVQCVFRCYGYTYPNQSMYQARAIRRQLESGAMRSVVAVAASGDVVGHVACTFDRPGDVIPEGGKMIVDPRYRGHHLADRLSLARAAMAAELGIPGVWAEAVTNHPASQRLAIMRGAAEVGLLVGVGPQSMLMSGLPNQEAVRHSLMAVFTPTGPLAPATISVPERLGDHMRAISGRLGAERELRHELVAPARARTRLHTAASALAGALEIRVLDLGADIVEQLADVLDEYLPMSPTTVHLHLPATDPSAAWAVVELERLGFVWCAWIPAFLPSGDSIRLQRVNDHPIQLEEIVCARPEGEEVRDFVVAEWVRVHRGRAAG